MEYRDQFTLKGPPRRVDDRGVASLDAALARAAGVPIDRILHAIDPRRIMTFATGGPPVWSVALSPCSDGCFLFVTYGLSRAIEPDSSFAHEMSIRVAPDASREPPAWPMFFLRQLARYQILGGRELAAGDPMTFGESITRAAMAPQEKRAMPDSPMQAIAVVDDPVLPGARRVLGLLPDEEALAEMWSTAGLVAEIALRDPTLTTDIARSSWSGDAALLHAVRTGAEREGAQAGAIVVPGVRWAEAGQGFEVSIPANSVRRVAALARGRICFGRQLLLHDHEPEPFTQVGLTPSDEAFVQAHGDEMLEIGLPADSPILWTLQAAANESTPSPVKLILR